MRLITQSNLEFGTGFVLGFPGQTDDDVANDIRFIRESGATKMVSVSCFTPGEETPLAGAEAGNFDKTLNAIAILRILFPDAQIPAPSNSDSPKIVRSDATGKSGLTLAIESGANEVTVNYTPERVRENYPIYDVAAKRPKVFLENALRISQETGMPLKIAETFDMPASIEHQYDEIGAMYVAEKRRFFSAIPDPGQKYILEHLKDVAGKDAVDVGCGGGDDMAVYRGLGFKSVVGVDPSKVMVAEAKKHLGDENAAVLGSWMNLPFENESKDYLIGRYSLQYAENLDTAFTEAARVLKLGGGLLLVVPFPRDYKNTFEKDGKKFVRTVLYDQKVPVVNPLHTMEEYLSPTFLSLFDVVDKGEYIGPEREDTSGKPDGMLLYARKK